jgi:hypothetical protein
MKTSVLRWVGVTVAALSTAWFILLGALVVRCKWSGDPFPVLAKFSPFREHLMVTDRCFMLYPVLAVGALVALGLAWYRERRFATVRIAALISVVLLLLSVLVVVVNPGGYFSWFLS